MFCGKCGSKNVDGASFCEVCGAPIGTAPRPVSAAEKTVQVSDARTNRKVGLIAVGVCVVVLLLGIFLIAHGRSATKTAETLMDGILDGDATVFVDVLPDKLIKEVMKERGISRKEMEEELSEYGEDMQYALGLASGFLGDSVKITYKVLEPERFSAEELREVKRTYKDLGITIKAASWVPVRISIRADGYNDSDTLNVPVIQVGRSWYLDISNINELLY